MNRTLTSPDSVVSPQSQRAHFSTAFILPGSTHAAGSRWHFRFVDPLFDHKYGLCVRSKRLRSTMNRTLTSPGSVVSPQSQQAQFSRD